MLGMILKVAGVTAALGFGAGVYAHRKAEKTKDAVKERFSKTETRVIQVDVPKGTKLEDCMIDIYVPNEVEGEELEAEKE
jgi:exonuclease III